MTPADRILRRETGRLRQPLDAVRAAVGRVHASVRAGHHDASVVGEVALFSREPADDLAADTVVDHMSELLDAIGRLVAACGAELSLTHRGQLSADAGQRLDVVELGPGGGEWIEVGVSPTLIRLRFGGA